MRPLLVLLGASMFGAPFTVAMACSPPPPIESITAFADLIVQGSARFSRAQGGATLRPTNYLKGRQAGPVRIKVDYTPRPALPAGLACPTYDLTGDQKGTFYLKRQRDGAFTILSFVQGRR